MQIKNYIALFLALLLLTRMVAFDGQLLSLVGEPGELVLVKHSCKMKNFVASTAEADNLEEPASGFELEYNSFCNTFFQFEVAETFEVFNTVTFHRFTSPVLSLYSTEIQITSPPPKAAA